jgi:hypothetical protein
MGCRCRERGDALTRIARSVREGEIAKPVAQDLKFIGQSMVEDAAKGISSKISAARASLQRRR